MNSKLSKACFDLLVEAAENNAGLTKEAPELDKLRGMGYIADGKITQKGLEALEPYRAKRAIFLAAGFGSRMVPVTLKTPKPLITVNGGRLIDGLIDACLNAGVEEIYLVRGYLAAEFDRLLDKYPMINFIDNTMYTEANNISSALLAKDLLQNAYVLEADLLLSNPEIIKKYHYQSNFLAIPMIETDDWCFDVEDGIIVKEKVGGKNCLQFMEVPAGKVDFLGIQTLTPFPARDGRYPPAGAPPAPHQRVSRARPPPAWAKSYRPAQPHALPAYGQ